MELVISILILFILVNCLLKLSFWKGWQAALFGLICGIFITATYPVAILQSKTQLADYLQVDRSALSNELSKMQRDGLLSYHKNHFILLQGE